MKWKKLGQIYHCKISHPLLQTHASNPLAVHLKDDIYRIYFSGRDSDNKSSVGFVDIDILTHEIIEECSLPVFTYGPPNSFYSHGVSIGNQYQDNNAQNILFMGWNIPENEHWRGDIGKIEIHNGNFSLQPKTAFLSTDEEDPISLSYPYVIFHEGIYKMWYGSTITWESENGEMIHVIKYATSEDGNHWKKFGIAIPYENNIAQAFSRPTVMIDELGYHMWYSFRSGTGTKYRIGYANSRDGLAWNRMHDETGIDVAVDGWDSEMICYPFVFDHKGQRYMLYNGNNYGKSGFGLAILEN